MNIRTNYKTMFLVMAILFLVAALVVGCGGSEPQTGDNGETGEPGEPGGDIEPASMYVGSEACGSCHTKAHEGYLQTSHATAFKPLSEYTFAEAPGEVVIYDDADKDGENTFTTVNLSDAVVGVMLDHYVVAKVPAEAGFEGGDYYRVGGIHEGDDGNWVLEPAKVKDYDSDGTEDWGVKTYGYCLKCHSPGLAEDTEEAGISCETCHGPGKEHVTAEKKAGTIVADEAACLTCHGDGRPSETDDPGVLVAQNHYGTRNWLFSPHAEADMLCGSCHTPHSINEEGNQLKAATTEESCSKCHGDRYAAADFMWVNPSDPYNHFSKDHGFGAYWLDQLGDDPATKPVEITDPDIVSEMKEIMGGE